MGDTRRVQSRQLLEGAPEQKEALAKRSELMPGSALYPSQLLQLKDVPSRLFALGNVETLTQPALAIVGARKATPYGLECAKRFARLAAARGIMVVSGGAIGCDMAAHQGALDAGGATTVVLGSGADVVYPLRARGLFLEVLDAGGVLLSEAPWGSAPLSWAFSRRNRIIAALAKATLIVEAGLPSGTFQTADHTLALGNDVLVVPGPIFSKESKGSNRLLLQGALPVVDDESFEETLEHIYGGGLFATSFAPVNQTPPQEERNGDGGEHATGTKPHEIKERRLVSRLAESLQANPMTVDDLASVYRESAVEIIRALSGLEIAGMVERLRDGRYMTKPPGGQAL